MNPIAKRTIVALSVAALVVAGLVYAPLCAVKPVVIALIILAQLELLQIVSRKYPAMVVPGVLAGAAYLVSRFYFPSSAISLIIFALAAFAAFRVKERPVAALATTVFSLVYLPVMLGAIIDIARLQSATGTLYLLYTIAIVKISDMGGFAFGLAFGKHKMCPAISPNKSWEGLAGSVFASCVISCSLMALTCFGWGKSLALGVVAALVGTAGDLVESRIKRECEVKDSATFMPAGMGGFLDMLDSLVFAPALLYPLLTA